MSARMAAPATDTEAVALRPSTVGPWPRFARLILSFGWQQAWSCLLPAGILAALIVTRLVDLPGLARYDWLLLWCLGLQCLMIAARLETLDEIKTITLFHAIGIAFELVKVHLGSWAYPEPALTKIGGVPLYAGFMYASVASYMCQSWRRLDLRLVCWPRWWVAAAITIAIYGNFLWHHLPGVPDLRYGILAALPILLWRTRVEFRVPIRGEPGGGARFHMPLVVSFALIGLFVWLAENIATLAGAWVYPHQAGGWRLVSPSKWIAWSLLVIVSFVLVAQLKTIKGRSRPSEEELVEEGDG